MAIQLLCSNPQCRKILTVPEELAGQEALCLSCGSHTTVPEHGLGDLEPGMKLGHNRIVRKIEEGNMGAVYEAVQEGLNRRVALKVFPQRFTTDPSYLKRFQQEAQIAAALDHRNIVRIYEIGEENGRYIFTTEFVDGESLRKWIFQNRQIPVEEAWDCLVQATRGLGHAWEHKIVHRDLKPEHLMICKDGTLKIAYLSVHKVTAGATNVIDTEIASALPHYMSPEQVKDSIDVDIRTDIYSLGATFYHLLTGQTPFDAPSPVELGMKIVRKPLRPIRELNLEVPVPFAGVLEKMMDKDPEKRYQTPADLLAGLDKANPQQVKEKLVKAQELVKLMSALETSQPQPTAPAERPSVEPKRATRPVAPIQPSTAGAAPPSSQTESTPRRATRPVQPVQQRPAQAAPPATPAAAPQKRATRPVQPVQPVQPLAQPPAAVTPAEPAQAPVPQAPGHTVFLATLALVLILLGVATFLGIRALLAPQSSNQPEQVTTPPERTGGETDPQREAMAGMFDYAAKYAEENPSDFPGIISRFETLKERGRNTEFEFKAEDQTKAWRAKWAASAQAELDKRKREAEGHLQANHFGEAGKLWKEFPEELRTEAIATLIEQETKKLTDRAGSMVGQMQAGVKALLDKDPAMLKDEEAATLSSTKAAVENTLGKSESSAHPLLAWMSAEKKTALKELGENIEAVLEAHKAAKAAEQAKAYNAFWNQFTQSIKAKKFKDTEDLLAANSPMLEEGTRNQLQADIQTLKSIFPRIEANLGNLKNKNVLIGGISMKVTDVREGKFTVRRNDEEVALGPEILDPEQQIDLASTAEKDAKTLAQQKAVFLFFYGSPAQAGKALEEARSQNVDISLYESRVLPILVVLSNPPGAAVELSPKVESSKAQGKGAKGFTTPLRVEVQRNTTYIVEIVKDGYGPVSKKIKVGLAGEHRVEAGLQKLKLPAALQEEFDLPSKAEDSRGNPVRKGEDPDSGYPYEIRHKGSGMFFVLVSAGSFQMGSPEGEKGRDADETSHSITFSQSFYIGKYEVTVGDFKRFVQKTGYRSEAERSGGWVWVGAEWTNKAEANWKTPNLPDQTDDYPVVLISWNDTQKFLNWMNGSKGERFRLPTEAEWEYACRGRTESRFFWGEEEAAASQYANVADRTAKQKFPHWPWAIFDTDDGFVYTAPVGRFKPNSFGLYDVIGNAWEWCSDWYEANSYSASPKVDPQGPTAGASKVYRGGHWAMQLAGDRSASRSDAAPDYRDWYSGFRIAFSLLER